MREYILGYLSAGKLNNFQHEQAEPIGVAQTLVCGVVPKSVRQMLYRTVFQVQHIMLAHVLTMRLMVCPIKTKRLCTLCTLNDNSGLRGCARDISRALSKRISDVFPW